MHTLELQLFNRIYYIITSSIQVTLENFDELIVKVQRIEINLSNEEIDREVKNYGMYAFLLKLKELKEQVLEIDYNKSYLFRNVN